MAVVEKGAGLDGHLIVGVDRAGDGDLVEEVKKVQMLIEHDSGAKNGIGLGMIETFFCRAWASPARSYCSSALRWPSIRATCGSHALVQGIVHPLVRTKDQPDILLLLEILQRAVGATSIHNNMFIALALQGMSDRANAQIDPAS